MTSPLLATEELDRLFETSSPALRVAMQRMTVGLVRRWQGEGTNALDEARSYLTRVAGAVAEYGNLLGRRRVLLLSRAVRIHGSRGRERLELSVPKIPHQEAIDDLKSREPKLAASSEEIRRLYREGKAFAMTNSTEQVLTERVQRLIGSALVEGGTATDLAFRILRVAGQEGAEDFTYGYADTVFRTNIATVYTEGLKTIARDPDVADVVPAFRYTATLDADTRPGHAALDGLSAGTSDDVWTIYSPPIWYRCRCGLELQDVYELRDAGRVKNGRVSILYPPTWSERERVELFALGA